MSGAHHTTITGLVAKVRELRDEKDDLDSGNDRLRGEIAAAFYMSADETPAAAFDALRQQLAAWPRSDWRELARRIRDYVDREL